MRRLPAVALTIGFAFLLLPLRAQPVIEEAENFALLRHWEQPEYPPEARNAKLEGEVTVDFVVDENGRVGDVFVHKSSDPRFDESALNAVRRWTFSPAMESGQAAASAMRVVVEFRLEQLRQRRRPTMPAHTGLLPMSIRMTPARVRFAPDPDYPAELEEKKLPGTVKMEFAVGVDGRPHSPRVLWASHAAFVETALRAIDRSEFEPMRQGPLPKQTTMEYPVTFRSIGATRTQVLAANRIDLIDSSALLPEPIVVTEPVYPRNALLAHEAGTAEVEFTVGPESYVTQAELIRSSAPDFGAALLAAVESWMIRPVAAEGSPVAAPLRLRVSYDFAPPAEGPLRRVAELLREGATKIPGPSGLDARLVPLWRGFPAYPLRLKGERIAGEALVEFVIDQNGRARFPAVVTATRPEFGWSAATAISQWVFQPPRRAGKMSDVRVRIPVSFVPPAPPAETAGR